MQLSRWVSHVVQGVQAEEPSLGIYLFFICGQGDARLEENPLFHHALQHAQEQGLNLWCIWVISPDVLETPAWAAKHNMHLPSLGPHRFRFLTERFQELAQELRAHGIPLLWETASPTDCAKQCVGQGIAVQACAMAESSAWNERQHLQVLRNWAEQQHITCHSAWMHTLYTPKQLPFSSQTLPLGFTSFRRTIENRSLPIDAPLSKSETKLIRSTAPETYWQLYDASVFTPPDYQTLFSGGVWDENVEAYYSSGLRFSGTRLDGLDHMSRYLEAAETAPVRTYKQTRNALLGDTGGGSRFSPWLASGTLGPKTLFYALKQHEARLNKNDSTYWLFVELLWREYFQWLSLKQGNTLFLTNGLKGAPLPATKNMALFQHWLNGTTGIPLHDAAMRELKQTGYISNRVRQTSASLLCKGLKLPWQWGAAVYEHYLIDYDPASNYGNWQYIAGIGVDPRDRVFNLYKQSLDYDPEGQYVKHWLPYLKSVPAPQCHNPEGLTTLEKGLYGLEETNVPFLLAELVHTPSFRSRP
jgi:deoxyribodipyrimidine photo-lyase